MTSLWPSFKAASGLSVTRMKFKEGPKFAYLIHQGYSSCFAATSVEALKMIKWPKSTPTGLALREWFAGFAEQDAAESGAKADDEANSDKPKIEIKRTALIGESPHQDAMSAIAAETQSKSQPDSPFALPEIGDEDPDNPLPFEVAAEDIEADIDLEIAQTKMVV